MIQLVVPVVVRPLIIKGAIIAGGFIAANAAVAWTVARSHAAGRQEALKETLPVQDETPKVTFVQKVKSEMLFFGRVTWEITKHLGVPVLLLGLGIAFAPVYFTFGMALLGASIVWSVGYLIESRKHYIARASRVVAGAIKRTSSSVWGRVKNMVKAVSTNPEEWTDVEDDLTKVRPLKVVPDPEVVNADAPKGGVDPKGSDAAFDEYNDVSEAESDAKVAALIDVLLEKDIRPDAKAAGRRLAMEMPDDIVSLEKGKKALDVWRRKSVLSRKDSDLLFSGYNATMAERAADLRRRQTV